MLEGFHVHPTGLGPALLRTWRAQAADGFLLTDPAKVVIPTRYAADDVSGVTYRFRWIPHREIRGDVAEIPPFAVLQILEMGRKTGVLQLETDDGPGSLWLCDGSPVQAETKSLRGFEAAMAVVNASAGQFAFEPSRAAPDCTIQASVTELLLEASRQLDEDGPRS